MDACPEPLVSSKQRIEMCKGTETVLLVEDAEPLRALAKEFLLDAGYTVLEAPNGTHALQIVREFDRPIHLLLTDVIMPGMCGKDLADEVTRLRPDTKVLFISGYPNDAITQAGILVSGISLLEKPFSRESLWRKVRQVLSATSLAKPAAAES